MAVLYAKTGGGDWSAAGTWSNSSAGGGDSSGPPTAADDVIFELLSGNVTIDSAPVCRSIDLSSGTGSYAGTITHNSAITLTIGDGTAGAGNVALKFVAGFTYTLGSATTSAITFVSTSAAAQDVDFAGKTTGNVTYNASSNGSWKMVGTHILGTAAGLTFTKGTLDTNGQTLTLSSTGLFNATNSNTRTLTLGASAITCGTWNCGTSTGLTLNAGTSSITMNGTSTTFSGGAKTYYSVSLTGFNPILDQSNTFTNLTRTGTAVIGDVLSVNGNQTVTGVLTFNGNSATNRLLVLPSNALGTQRTFTNAGATVAASYVDLQDIALSVSTDLSAITGGCGDAGGNSGITFTTAATQTWQGTTSGSWSNAAKWTSRVPLPQDDVVISSAFSASQTITVDMRRLGKSIDFTGTTGSPVFALGSNIRTFFGSLTLVSAMSVTSTERLVFQGRGSHTITTAGLTIPSSSTGWNFQSFGGTYTLQDALTTSGALTHTHGTLDTNGQAVSCTTFSTSASTTRTLTLGASTITLTGTGTVWNAATATGLTLNANSSTIKLTDTSSTQKTFSGGGKTYNNLWYAPGAGTATLNFVGSNTFNDFKDDGSAAHSVLFTAGTTSTFASWTGLTGSVVTIGSITASGHTLTKTGGTSVSTALAAVSRSTATPSDSWFAGSGATDGGNNSGWSFTTLGSGAGAAAGTGALSAVEQSGSASDGASSGTGALSAVGGSLAAGDGASSGTGAASGTGASNASADGAASGAGALSVTGGSLATSDGGSSGAGALSGAAISEIGDGAASGSGTAAGIGQALSEAAGAAAGIGSLSAGGTGVAPGDGAASGSGTVASVGGALVIAAGVGSGAGVGAGAGASEAAGAGLASGIGTITSVALSGASAGAAAGTGAIAARALMVTPAERVVHVEARVRSVAV